MLLQHLHIIVIFVMKCNIPNVTSSLRALIIMHALALWKRCQVTPDWLADSHVHEVTSQSGLTGPARWRVTDCGLNRDENGINSLRPSP